MHILIHQPLSPGTKLCIPLTQSSQSTTPQSWINLVLSMNRRYPFRSIQDHFIPILSTWPFKENKIRSLNLTLTLHGHTSLYNNNNNYVLVSNKLELTIWILISPCTLNSCTYKPLTRTKRHRQTAGLSFAYQHFGQLYLTQNNRQWHDKINIAMNNSESVKPINILSKKKGIIDSINNKSRENINLELTL